MLDQKLVNITPLALQDSQLHIGRVIACNHGRATKIQYKKHYYSVNLHCKHISYLNEQQLIIFTCIDKQLIIVAELQEPQQPPCSFIAEYPYHIAVNKGDSCFTLHRNGEMQLSNKHAKLRIDRLGDYALEARSIKHQAKLKQQLIGYPIHLN